MSGVWARRREGPPLPARSSSPAISEPKKFTDEQKGGAGSQGPLRFVEDRSLGAVSHCVGAQPPILRRLSFDVAYGNPAIQNPATVGGGPGIFDLWAVERVLD
jgi:hypothetical protein